MNYLSFSKQQGEIGIRLWMRRKRADAFGDGLVVVRKSLGLGLLAVKARNNGICGDRVGRGMEKLHSNMFIALLNIMIHPTLHSKT